LKIIALHPTLGRKTAKENVRVKIVRDYFLIYGIMDEEIVLLAIWDSRQNPAKLDY